MLLLSVLAGVTAFSATAAAANGPAGMAGSGTSDDPYVVTNATQLQAMAEDLDAHYELGSNVDASNTSAWDGGDGFAPVGNSSSQFTGSFDGNGYAVSGLWIDRASETEVGLFSHVGSGGSVANVTLVDANVTGGEHTGALVGFNDGTISKSGSTGTVIGGDQTGGLVGQNKGTIRETYSIANVTSTGIGGGLVGYTGYASGLMEDSYARGNVSTEGNAGGLIGRAWNDGTVRDSYATGNVSGEGSHVAGVIGYNEDSETADLYWDNETTGQSIGGETRGYDGDFTGLTTAQLTGSSAEANLDLDFATTWAETDGYPVLQWQIDSYSQSLDRTTIVDGSSTNATVTLSLDDGSTVTATEPATFSTTDAGVATVSSGGRVDGLTVGSVAISATHVSRTDSVTLDVVDTENDGWWTGRASLGRTGYTPTATGPGSSIGSAWTFNFTYNASDPDEYQGSAYATKNPAIVNGTLYFTSGNGRLYALDAATGEQAWRVDTEGTFWSSPTVVNGTVYVADDTRYDSSTQSYAGGYLYALDAETGTERWRYDIDAYDSRGDDYRRFGASGSFPVANGTIYFADENATVHAVDVESGDADWTVHAYEDEGDFEHADFDYGPAIVNGTLYVQETDGELYAIDAATGQTEWRVEPTRFGVRSGLAVGNSTVFTGGYDADRYRYQLIAYHAETGDVAWTAPFAGQYEQPVGSAAYADGTVYVTTSAGNLSAYDAGNGTRLWVTESTPDGHSYSRYEYGPVVADGTVYTNHYSWSYGGYVHAVDAETGQEEWAYDVSTKYLYTTPTVWDGRVYVGGQHYRRTDGGYLFEGRLQALSSAVTLSITNTSAPVTETETLTVNASVTNNRGASTTETVRLRAPNGSVVDSTSVSLDDGETEPVALTWSTALGDDGNREITVEVPDEATETATVAILDDAPPTARAGGNVTVGTDDEVGVDGSRSTDVGGITSYDWDFGDGTSGAGPTAANAYTADGNYTVTLTVTDTVGQTATDTMGVRVINDSLLIADPGTNYTVEEGAQLELNGSDSAASAGIAAYAWDVDANGTVDETGATPTHTFDELGDYPVTLTVTDALGNTAAATTVVEVTDATDPVPDAGSDRTVRERDQVAFDGTNSTDNVGVTRYRWDFDGDGTYDANGSRPTYTYTDAGTYTLTLDTTDAAGNNATDTATVDVMEFTPPNVTLRIDRTDSPVLAGEPLTVNVTATNFGDASATQTINLTDSGGVVRDGQQVTLPSNESRRFALTWATASGDDGRTTIAVQGDNDTATEAVTIRRRATFDVAIAETNAPIDEGGNLTVQTEVENVGDLAGTQTIELTAFDGTVVNTTTLTLDPGERRTIPMTWGTQRGDAATDRVSVASDNETASAVLRLTELSPAKYSVAILRTDAPVATGDGLTVRANVTNVGDLAGSPAVNLTVNGSDRASDLVSLSGGANRTVALTWTPDPDDVGSHGIDVAVPGANDSTTVTVTDGTPPEATVGANRTVVPGAVVSFNGSGSTDNVGVTSYTWSFEDGTDTTGATVDHNYTTVGTYTATLNVSDAAGNTDTEARVITVREPTGDGGGGGGGGGGGAGGDTQQVVVEQIGAAGESASAASRVTIQNAEPNTRVSIDVSPDAQPDRNGGGADSGVSGGDAPPATGSILMDRVEMTVERGGAFQLEVETEASPLESIPLAAGQDEPMLIPDLSTAAMTADEQQFLEETGRRSAGTIRIDHAFADSEVRDVRLQFRVRKSHLRATNVDPETVQLYRSEPTGWRALPTSQVAETEEYYRFAAPSPGLSVFAIGTVAPVFEIESAHIDAGGAPVRRGDPITVTVTVRNVGEADGRFTSVLTAGPDRLANATAMVPSGTTRTVELEAVLQRTGRVALELNGDPIETVEVVEPGDATGPGQVDEVASAVTEAVTDAGASPWFVVLGGLIAVLVVALPIGLRRRFRD